MWIPKDVVSKALYVVCVVTNPVRFKTRWKLYRDFANHVRNSGAILVTVEAALGDRAFALEEHAPLSREPLHSPVSHGPPPVAPRAGQPESRFMQDYLKFKLGHLQHIWQKECLQNIAAMHLPREAEYIAFIDADIGFDRPDWVSETLHALQHYDVVQMFSRAIDLSPTYEPLAQHFGFVYCYLNGVPMPKMPGYYYADETPTAPCFTWHPGYAWAWRRSALNTCGGLLDIGILGAGDNHMARSLIGLGHKSFHAKVHPAYKRRVLEWQDRAKALHKNVGYIDGTIKHYWHGRKANRRYVDRWQILVKHQFNPDRDLQKDITGINALVKGRKPRLRDDTRRYFAQRNEDSIDVDVGDYRMVGPLPWPPLPKK